MAYRSFLLITRDMRMARSLHLEGKTDSETMYWKYTLSSAFLKLCPSNQVPPPACLSQLQHVPKWSQSGGQKYFREDQKASHGYCGAQNALEKSQAEQRCESWLTSEHQGGLELPVRYVLLRQWFEKANCSWGQRQRKVLTGRAMKQRKKPGSKILFIKKLAW